MQRPEDTLPPGLTWQRFRSAYAISRRGAPSSEVSEAWNRYKERTGVPTSRRKSPRRSSPRRSPKRSPNRTSIVNPYNLANLPGDVLRNIASQRPGAATVLTQLARRTHQASQPSIISYCTKVITRKELLDLAEDYLTRLRNREGYRPPLPPGRRRRRPDIHTRLAHMALQGVFSLPYATFFPTHVRQGPNNMGYTNREGGVEIRVEDYGHDLEATTEAVTFFLHQTSYHVGPDEDLKEVAKRLLPPEKDYDKLKHGVILPGIPVIREIMERRTACRENARTLTRRYVLERIHTLFHSLGSRYMESLLEESEWNVEEIVQTIIRDDEGTPGLSLRKVLLFAGLSGWLNWQHPFEPGFWTKAYRLRPQVDYGDVSLEVLARRSVTRVAEWLRKVSTGRVPSP